MRVLANTFQRLIMPHQRLKVLQDHLCFSTRVSISNTRGSASSPSSSVQKSLQFVQNIVEAETLRSAESAAGAVISTYSRFDSQEKSHFHEALARNYQCDPQLILDSVAALTAATEKSVPHKQHRKLRDALVSPYELLFREIGAIGGGVKFLVDLRSDLIDATRNCREAEQLTALQAMNHSLKRLLSLWFGVGFLSLERITWQSSCNLLEKVAAYEGVHPVRNVSDLKTRVGAYRRCFTFMHPSMPGEPMVILHVALVKDISRSIQAIVRHPSLSNQSDFQPNQQEDPSTFNTAIFYSITSTQPGLKGIDLGNYLIKSVVRQLLAEFPHLTNFSSLSPIPGFRDWLFTEINQTCSGSKRQRMLTDEQVMQCTSALHCPADELSVLSALKLRLGDGVWCKDNELAAALKDTLMSLCARYLYKEKHRGFALNAVANFHLRNGATLWRINWLANTTAKGLTESCAMMVNYKYHLDRTSANSDNYSQAQGIDADSQVIDLLT